MQSLIRRALGKVRDIRDYMQLPEAAKREERKDRAGPAPSDPGTDRVVETGVEWLEVAQGRSASHDGVVARDYSLVNGWAVSYPETTGYIVPTLLAYARMSGDVRARVRARQMLDWIVSIQFPEGFQGGTINAQPRVPVTFNTGQMLIGLASGVVEFGDDYREPMRRAADWLVATQDSDGCWRRHGTPFAAPGEKIYETHAAWGLFEAARLEPGKPYGEVSLANVRWALTHQRQNGWLANCCLTDAVQPLTHTVGYALRGFVEAYRFAPSPDLLSASRKTADGLMTAQRKDGSLPGRLDAEWKPAVDWACLTGIVQIAHSWLLLYRLTRETRYRDAAYAANRYVRRTIRVDGPEETRGAVKGSFPVNGGYGPYQYVNWACKFSIDANLLEREVRASE